MLFKKVILIFLTCILIFTSSCSKQPVDETTKITVALPYSSIQLSESDEDYINFIENELNIAVELVFIPSHNLDGYMSMILGSEQEEVDIILFSEDNMISPSILESSENVLSLNELIEQSGYYLNDFANSYEHDDIINMITSADGNIYYVPSIDNSFVQTYFQTMWINVNWLEDLGMSIPKTIDEFTQILRTFKENYPDGVPVIGAIDDDSMSVFQFLMNAFVYCDQENNYLAVENGEVFYTPTTDEFRQGLAYLNSLYEEGLIVDENFTYTQDEVFALCNDPRNLVGVFCSNEIGDALSENSPHLLSYYLSVQPISSETHTGVAVVRTPETTVGGIILKSSDNQQKAFEVLDFMCSEQAFLFGNYGEQGVDWDYSETGDISAIGTNSKITIQAESELMRDSEQFSIIGPNLVREEFANNITWKGYQVNQNDYLDARAYRLYESYYPEEFFNDADLSKTTKKDLENASAYVQKNMYSFIKGKLDINNNSDWEKYIHGFEKFPIEEIVAFLNQ